MKDLHFSSSVELPVSASAAFAWHERPGAFERLVPSWQHVRVLDHQGTIRDGDRLSFEVRLGPLRRSWVAVHEGFSQDRVFADRQERGPFAEWRHEHRFIDRGETAALEDVIAYRLPLGSIGQRLGRRYAASQLERLFAFRHRRLLHDLERHQLTTERLRIAITGSSGLIGSALAAFLSSGGHDVLRIARDGSDHAGLEGVDAVVHLAGEPIGRRWTAARKREILRSRDEGTRTLATRLASLEHPPRVLVSASAVGIYGSRGDEILTETSEHGDDFLSSVCEAWEAGTLPAAEAGIRVVNLRFGVVLEALLPRLLLPFRLGLGGRIGNGRHWLSWIALDDVTAAVHQAIIDESLRGPVNATSPAPVTNAELTKLLGRVLNRPTVLPLPAVAVTTLFGEMGKDMLLASQRALPHRLQAAGFGFAYPELEPAIRNALGR